VLKKHSTEQLPDVHKYKDKYTNTQILIHKYKVHKYKYTCDDKYNDAPIPVAVGSCLGIIIQIQTKYKYKRKHWKGLV
jgi:hypothetical protein